MMKKIWAAVCAAAMLMTGAALAETDVRVTALKGPTAMGMVELMNEAESGAVNGNAYDFTIASAVDEVSPKLLYIVESGDSIGSVEDLRGKTIYASGKGATPEYALNYILTENGIDPEKDVTIEWKSEHAECLAALMAEDNAIAMLPQPFVTTAQTKSDKIQVRLDLTAEWNAIQKDSDAPSQLITGVVVARKAFIEENPEAVSAFMDSYAASVDFVNANIDEAAELVGKYEIVPAAVAQKAIPACNITFIAGGEMKQALSGYLSVLFEQNPKAVGGAMPGDDFYYAE